MYRYTVIRYITSLHLWKCNTLLLLVTIQVMYHCLLYVPRYNMTNYSRRVFSYAGPHACNLLPENVWESASIAIFKHSLKTFLFKQIMHSVRWRRFVV